MLSKYEQETIINFNKEEKIAYIFTYEKTWQIHLEKRLGLEPTLDNGFGGKGYQIDKKRIKPPRAKRKMSKATKEALLKSILSRKNTTTKAKSKVKV